MRCLLDIFSFSLFETINIYSLSKQFVCVIFVILPGVYCMMCCACVFINARQFKVILQFEKFASWQPGILNLWHIVATGILVVFQTQSVIMIYTYFKRVIKEIKEDCCIFKVEIHYLFAIQKDPASESKAITVCLERVTTPCQALEQMVISGRGSFNKV